MATYDISRISYAVTAILQNGNRVQLDEAAENIAWEENETELAVRLNLTIRDIPYGGGRLSTALPLCTAIQVYADWGAGQQQVFQGTIWEWEFSQVDGDAIIITAYDVLYYLQRSSDNRYYAAGRTTKAIITDILTAWGVPIGQYTAGSATHQKMLFKNKTIAAMLTETLEDARKLGADKALIRSNQGKADIIRRGGNATVYGLDSSAAITQSRDRYSIVNLVTRVIVVGKEDKEGRPKVEATLNGLTQYGVMQAIHNMGSATLADAKAEAQETLDENGKPERSTTITAPDFPAIRKGDVLHITTDRVKGYFVVKGIAHSATASTMQMEVEPA